MSRQNLILLYAAAAISGVMAVLAYPLFELEFLIWFAFAPVIFAAVRNSPSTSSRHFFWAGLLAGTLYYAVLLRWFFSIYPLDWAGIENKLTGFIFLLLAWLLSASVFGVLWGGWLYIFKKTLLSKISWPPLILAGAGWFVLLSWLGSFAWSVLWWSGATDFGGHWTIGNLAYALHNNPMMREFSKLVGIYGISFVILCVNFIILWLLLRAKSISQKLLTIMSVSALIILVSILPRLLITPNYLLKSATPKEVSFAAVQTRIPSVFSPDPKEAFSGIKQKIALFQEIIMMDSLPQLIILPEGANFFKDLGAVIGEDNLEGYLKKSFADDTTLIIDHTTFLDGVKRYSRIAYIDPLRGLVGGYDKKVLTPGGEYVPFIPRLFIQLISPEVLASFEAQRLLEAGRSAPQPVAVNYQDISAPHASGFICSELFSPGIFRQGRQSGAEIFVVLASTAIFKGSETLIKQNQAVAQLQAAQFGTPLLLVANFGRSYAIDQNGFVRTQTLNSQPQLFTGTLVLHTEKTLYTKLGDAPILLIILAIALGSFWRFFSHGYKS